MVSPLAAAGVQLAGSIIGGLGAKKAAKEMRKEAIRQQRWAMQLRELDRAAAAALARENQKLADAHFAAQTAKAKAGVGVDLKKLRDDAIAAGFNPLTVLEMVGGAYEAPFLSSPFFDTPFLGLTDVALATGANVINAQGGAGSFAQALGAGVQSAGNAYFSNAQSNADRAAQMMIARAVASERAVSARHSAGAFGASALPPVDPAPRSTGWSFGQDALSFESARFDDPVNGSVFTNKDRPIEREGMRDVPFYTEVTNPDGSKVYVVNQDWADLGIGNVLFAGVQNIWNAARSAGMGGEDWSVGTLPKSFTLQQQAAEQLRRSTVTFGFMGPGYDRR